MGIQDTNRAAVGTGGGQWRNQGCSKAPRSSCCYTRRNMDIVRFSPRSFVSADFGCSMFLLLPYLPISDPEMYATISGRTFPLTIQRVHPFSLRRPFAQDPAPCRPLFVSSPDEIHFDYLQYQILTNAFTNNNLLVHAVHHTIPYPVHDSSIHGLYKNPRNYAHGVSCLVYGVELGSDCSYSL